MAWRINYFMLRIAKFYFFQFIFATYLKKIVGNTQLQLQSSKPLRLIDIKAGSYRSGLSARPVASCPG
jgi:hypothetical protein